MDLKREALNALSTATQGQGSPEIAAARARAVASFYGTALGHEEVNSHDDQS